MTRVGSREMDPWLKAFAAQTWEPQFPPQIPILMLCMVSFSSVSPLIWKAESVSRLFRACWASAYLQVQWETLSHINKWENKRGCPCTYLQTCVQTHTYHTNTLTSTRIISWPHKTKLSYLSYFMESFNRRIIFDQILFSLNSYWVRLVELRNL